MFKYTYTRGAIKSYTLINPSAPFRVTSLFSSLASITSLFKTYQVINVTVPANSRFVCLAYVSPKQKRTFSPNSQLILPAKFYSSRIVVAKYRRLTWIPVILLVSKQLVGHCDTVEHRRECYVSSTFPADGKNTHGS